MATTQPNQNTPNKGIRVRPAVLLSFLALFAPMGYLVGRLSVGFLAGTYLSFLASGLVATTLGVMMGIPIGLFFGSLRQKNFRTPDAINSLQIERSILEQIRSELIENQALFTARKGSTTMFARIEYITPFWTSIKASGKLFVMQNMQLVSSIATAYYWLDQASHLELLAYEAKYAHPDEGDHATAAKLISEARLLDGQLQNTLTAAIAAVDDALAS